jgi:hypothetical protein
MTICCIRVTLATFFHPLAVQMSQFIQSPRPPLAGLYSIFNGGPLEGESSDALIESDSPAEMGDFFNRRWAKKIGNPSAAARPTARASFDGLFESNHMDNVAAATATAAPAGALNRGAGASFLNRNTGRATQVAM